MKALFNHKMFLLTLFAPLSAKDRDAAGAGEAGEADGSGVWGPSGKRSQSSKRGPPQGRPEQQNYRWMSVKMHVVSRALIMSWWNWLDLFPLSLNWCCSSSVFCVGCSAVFAADRIAKSLLTESLIFLFLLCYQTQRLPHPSHMNRIQLLSG